ncbi:MAG: pentapeptide repeat-containing protein [Aphanizomenon gracile PMC627.10]|nr:pentapeptide repeat-containing protein [Aphanizomenon gracile PMC627.10]
MAETNTTENLTQAKEYLTIALEVVKSAEIKNDIAANLELLKSRTGTSGGRERREGETPAIKITTERALQMLRGGEAGIKAWNQFRKMESYIPSLEGVDLSGQNLRNANLSEANLKNSNFKQAVLGVVIFSNSNLVECDFTDAKLYNTNFNNSDLKNSKFIQASFTEVNFNSADLESADLTSVLCYSSSFANANLQNAILNQSRGFILTFYKHRYSEDIRFIAAVDYVTNTSENGRDSRFIDRYQEYIKTDFQGANLSGAFVIGANLQECNLEGANLTNTNFSNANLYRANLKNTTIDDTDFRGTDLRKADLTGANVYYRAFHDNAQVSGTIGID